MTTDAEARAFFRGWSTVDLPNNDSGAQELRRRAMDAAYDVFRVAGLPVDPAGYAEALAVALAERCESEGIPMPTIE